MENNFLRKSKNILMVNKIKMENKQLGKTFYFKNNEDLVQSGLNKTDYVKSEITLSDEQRGRFNLLNKHLLVHPGALSEISINDFCMFVETGFINPNVGHGLDSLSTQYENESKTILLDGVKDVLKEVRKEKENFGIIYNDHIVKTTEETLSTLVTILTNFNIGVYDKVDYKTEDGYIKDMTKEQITELITKANNWVNDAYKSESTILGTLEKMSLKDMVDKYDFNIGFDNKLHFEITDEIQYYFEQIFAVHSGNSDETLEELEKAYLEHKKDENNGDDGDNENEGGDTPPPIDPPKLDTPIESETTNSSGDNIDTTPQQFGLS